MVRRLLYLKIRKEPDYNMIMITYQNEKHSFKKDEITNIISARNT